jgi:hypothetical protein
LAWSIRGDRGRSPCNLVAVVSTLAAHASTATTSEQGGHSRVGAGGAGEHDRSGSHRGCVMGRDASGAWGSRRPNLAGLGGGALAVPEVDLPPERQRAHWPRSPRSRSGLRDA